MKKLEWQFCRKTEHTKLFSNSKRLLSNQFQQRRSLSDYPQRWQITMIIDIYTEEKRHFANTIEKTPKRDGKKGKLKKALNNKNQLFVKIWSLTSTHLYHMPLEVD